MKKVLISITVTALLLSLLVVASYCPAKADSTEAITFDSGVTVYSPVNTTYYNTNLILSVGLYGAGNMGGLDPQLSMNYSIDGLYNGAVHLVSDGQLHVVTNGVGTANLPNLSEGSHILTLYYYGLNQRSYDPKYLSYINTIQFSTVGQAPSLTPTSPPTPNPTPTPTTSSQPISTPQPTQVSPTATPSINASSTTIGAAFITANSLELAIIAIVTIILVAFGSLLLLFRHHKRVK
jgi:hypothetical protein